MGECETDTFCQNGKFSLCSFESSPERINVIHLLGIRCECNLEEGKVILLDEKIYERKISLVTKKLHEIIYKS